jgi:hypothetical protein
MYPSAILIPCQFFNLAGQPVAFAPGLGPIPMAAMGDQKADVSAATDLAQDNPGADGASQAPAPATSPVDFEAAVDGRATSRGVAAASPRPPAEVIESTVVAQQQVPATPGSMSLKDADPGRQDILAGVVKAVQQQTETLEALSFDRLQLPLLTMLFEVADTITLWLHERPTPAEEDRIVLQAVLDQLFTALRCQGIDVLHSSPGEPVQSRFMQPYGGLSRTPVTSGSVVNASVKCGYLKGNRVLRPETVVVTSSYGTTSQSTNDINSFF